MRIIIASDLHWPTINGVATFSRNLAHGLADRNHEVLVIAPSQTGKKYREIDRNHQVVRTSSLTFPFYQNFKISLSPYSEVKKIIANFQPDIIHIQSPLGIGRAALNVGKKLNIPVVATNHAMPENLIDNLRLLAPFARPISYILKEYGTRFYRNADFITLPTAAAIKMFDENPESETTPIKPVSNGIDLSRFKPGRPSKELLERFGLPADKPIVMYLGRIDAEKHVSTLLKAFAAARQKVDAHLLVVGFGNDLDNLRHLANDLGIKDHATFTGKVEDEDVPKLQQCGTVFVMPSPAELQCIAMLEAMASGQPAIAVNVGALYELCQDGRNGYLCDVDDDEHISERIVKILSDKKLRDKMSKESLAISKTHDMQFTLNEFENIYSEAIANKAKELVETHESL